MVCELKTITIDGKSRIYENPPGCSKLPGEEIYRSYKTCTQGRCEDDFSFQQNVTDQNEVLKHLEDINDETIQNGNSDTSGNTSISTTNTTVTTTGGKSSEGTRNNSLAIAGGIFCFLFFVFSITTGVLIDRDVDKYKTQATVLLVFDAIFFIITIGLFWGYKESGKSGRRMNNTTTTTTVAK